MKKHNFGPSKIISGGQTGVDRAALDAALELGIPIGGWCPRGRKSEDGTIPDKYPLIETPKSYSLQRTEWNIRDSDATLILIIGKLEGGTRRTAELAHQMGKPYFIIDLNKSQKTGMHKYWLEHHHPAILNIAGPRESKSPGIAIQAKDFLATCFGMLKPDPHRDK